MNSARKFSWKVVCCTLLALLCLAATAFAAKETYVLEKETVYRVAPDGTRQKIENVDVMPAENVGIFWVAVDPENNEEMKGSEGGIYFFDDKDQPLFFLPYEDAATVGNIFFSPDGKQMVMDTGTWVVRDLFLYDFKATEAKATLTGMYDPIWLDPHRFAFTMVESDKEPRPVESDFDGWTSIVVYDTAVAQIVPVIEATETQNYLLTGADLDKGELKVTETSVKQKADWADLDKQEDKEISVPLPAAG